MTRLPEDPAELIEVLAELDRRDKDAQRAAETAHDEFMAALSEAMDRGRELNKTRLAERIDRARHGLDVSVKRWRKRKAEDQRVAAAG